MNAQTTLNSAIAAGFDKLSTHDLLIATVFGANSAGGAGVTTGTVPPTGTATNGALYINLTDNTLWNYNSGWKQLV